MKVAERMPFVNKFRLRIIQKLALAAFISAIIYPFLEGVPMYAIVKTGGKQYKVAAGKKLKIEYIPAEISAEITLDQVLAVGAGESIRFGAPLVTGASVKAIVVAQDRHPKIKIFKMRRRKHYQKHAGHRQRYTELQINEINY